MNFKTRAMTVSAVCVAANVILGTLTSFLKIPLIFLDTVGTILSAVLFGPLFGAITGLLTNLIQGILTNPKDIPFALVNIAIGLIVGFICKKRNFDLKTAIIVGIILAVVAPLIGTPIAVWIYGGITGDGNDFIFAWLSNTGHSIFSAAFIPRITGNIIDKIVSCLMVMFLIKAAPNIFNQKLKNNK